MKATRGGIATVAVLVATTLILALLGAAGDDDKAAANATRIGGGLSAAVPAEFAPWVTRAGSLCPEFPPALIAAQIDVESSWNVNAVGPRVGDPPQRAEGPSQFMPGTWAAIGRDDDSNGRISPFDIGDAVMAQGRLDCQLVEEVRVLGGDVVRNALAAYNSRPAAVLQYHGVPPFPETQDYVTKVLKLTTKYAGAPAAGPLDSSLPAKVRAVIAAAETQLGVPYAWGGGGPTGPSEGFGDGAGIVGFDCSGLVQYAFAQGAGLSLPRLADQQGRVGRAVPRSQLQPGDVIAFARSGGRYFHVGIYIGGGQMIQAPKTNDVVKISPVINDPYYESFTWSIRRYL